MSSVIVEVFPSFHTSLNQRLATSMAVAVMSTPT